MHVLEVVCGLVLALHVSSPSAIQDTHLFYTYGESLYRITMEGTHQQMLVRHAGRAAIFDYNQRDELLFWTDGKGGTIHTMFMNGTGYKIIRLVDAIISGLAVNWKENQLYWSNVRTGTIEQLDLIGGRSRAVMRNVSQPGHLSVDVMNRALLYASAGATPSIHFLSLEKTGAHRTWPVGCRVSGITADPPKKRIFWACSIRRSSSGFLGSRRYEGRGLRVIPLPTGSKPAGITVAADSVVYADAGTNAIHRVAWPSGRIVTSLNLGTSSSSLGEIRVVPAVQWNGKAAMMGGVQLRRAKNVPLLLFANGLDIRRVHFDGTGYRNVTAQAPYGHVSGITFDPLEGKVYFVNSSHHHIERIGLDGAERSVVFRGHRGLPQGIALDWIQRKLYWTVPEESCIVEGSLNGSQRDTFYCERGSNPQALAVHPQAGLVFWTEAFLRPCIRSLSISGHQTGLIAAVGLISPRALALDTKRSQLYWSDEGRGVIETSSMDGTQRRVFAQTNTDRVSSLAVYGDSLWYSVPARQALVRLRRTSGQRTVHLHGESMQPTALLVVPAGTDDFPTDNHEQALALTRLLVVNDSPGSSSTATNPTIQETVPDRGRDMKFQQSSHTELTIFTSDPSSSASTQAEETRTLTSPKPTNCCNNVRSEEILRPDSSEEQDDEIGCTNCSHKADGHLVECPEALRHFCLNGGQCQWVQYISKPMCRCVSGYVGERCHHNELEPPVGHEQARTTLITTLTTLAVGLLLVLVIVGIICSCRT